MCLLVCRLPCLVKDKAEILLQVEELLHIKEELSSQVDMSGIENEKLNMGMPVFLRLNPPFCTGDVTTWCSGTRALESQRFADRTAETPGEIPIIVHVHYLNREFLGSI